MGTHLYWVSALTYAFVLGIILASNLRVRNKQDRVEKSFRRMATWVMFFCIQDAVWGLCEARVIQSDSIFFFSSSVFHMSTVFTTFFWLGYVLDYLGDKVKHRKLYLCLDVIVILFEITLVIRNIFKPTLFWIEEGSYVTASLRSLSFFNQYIVYLGIGIITLYYGFKKAKGDNIHYRTVFLFTLAPILLGGFSFCIRMVHFIAWDTF